MTFTFEPIGVLRSCYQEKFSIPRQPGLVPEARGIVKLNNRQEFRDAIRGLEEFSHIWLLTVFHDRGELFKQGEWKPRIRPPRLGGARKIGVLASRSPHRPNPISLSAVALERIDADARGGPELHVLGVDILDGSPVLDIKPYIAFADSIPHATTGWASDPLPNVPVNFAAEAMETCRRVSARFPGFEALIRKTLALDPRPGFLRRRAPDGEAAEAAPLDYAARIADTDVHWSVKEGVCTVTEIRELPPRKLT